MFAGFVITLREGLEAALVVAIMMGVLRRLDRLDQARAAWGGVFAAILVSLVVGVVLNRLGVTFEGPSEAAFEGLVMLMAAAMLTWMILWMQRQGPQVRSALEQDTIRAASQDSAHMLFGLSFVAVLREGLETALFLTAAAFGLSPVQTLVGGALGLLCAAILGWLIYMGERRLNLRAFFRLTSFLLILFSAGLVAHGIRELQEVALLPWAGKRVWDLSSVLSESSILGSILKTLLGYNPNPSWLEVVGYIAYFPILWAVNRHIQRRHPRAQFLAGG